MDTEVRERVEGIPATRALYYENAYTSEFEANVLKSFAIGGKTGIILNQTAFYPEGGGQPGDVGVLETRDRNIISIVNTIHEEGLIVHIAESYHALNESSLVRGRVDWDRRYSLMKNHTASHIVFSSVRNVMQLEGLAYKGSQLGVQRSRIDVNAIGIDRDTLVRIEVKANQICQEKRPVRAWYDEKDEALKKFGSSLGLTDVTPTGKIRIVEIDGWDRAACCGTHVSSSSECSPIKILGRERISDGTDRIEFMVGDSAYDYFRSVDERLWQISKLLKSGPEDIQKRIQRLLQDNETLKTRAIPAKEERAQQIALQLSNSSEAHNAFKLIIRQLPDLSLDLLKEVVSIVASKNPEAVALLGTFSEGKGILIARTGDSIGARLDLGGIISVALKSVGGRGGGSAVHAQGSTPTQEALSSAIESCKSTIIEKLDRLSGPDS